MFSIMLLIQKICSFGTLLTSSFACSLVKSKTVSFSTETLERSFRVHTGLAADSKLSTFINIFTGFTISSKFISYSTFALVANINIKTEMSTPSIIHFTFIII